MGVLRQNSLPQISLDPGCGGIIVSCMRKSIYILISIAFLPLFSCADSSETARRPVGPESDESYMPWNRPTGPEGAGALSILDQR